MVEKMGEEIKRLQGQIDKKEVNIASLQSECKKLQESEVQNQRIIKNMYSQSEITNHNRSQSPFQNHSKSKEQLSVGRVSHVSH